jgi:hypothetical protein
MKHAVAKPLSLVVAVFVAIATAWMWSGTTTHAQATTAQPALVPNPLVTVAHNYLGKATSRMVGTTSDGRQVTGSFVPLRFGVASDRLRVRGLISGVVHNASGTTSTFSVLKVIPVKTLNGVPARATAVGAAAATCDILHLVLAPLDLDLLGLRVHLDRVVLNIVAASGAGNLLGNLLCAVAGLLDGGLSGLLGRISDLLNRILAVLRLVG